MLQKKLNSTLNNTLHNDIASDVVSGVVSGVVFGVVFDVVFDVVLVKKDIYFTSILEGNSDIFLLDFNDGFIEKEVAEFTPETPNEISARYGKILFDKYINYQRL